MEPHAHDLADPLVSERDGQGSKLGSSRQGRLPATQAMRVIWGARKSCGYNLVRFLHLDSLTGLEVIVRVPLHSGDGASRGCMQIYCNRIASEVSMSRSSLPFRCHMTSLTV